MNIAPRPPWRFTDGDILAPSSVNGNNLYFLQAARARAAQRRLTWTQTAEFCPSASAPLTAISNPAYLKRDIPPAASRSFAGAPVTAISAAFTVFYTSSTAWTASLFGGKVTVTFPARAAALATTPYFITELFNVQMTGTSTRAAELNLAATTSIASCRMELGFTSDRFACGSYTGATAEPTIPGTLGEVDDTTPAEAAVFNTIQTNCDNLAAAVVVGIPVAWAAADLFGVTSATPISGKRAVLPAYTPPAYAQTDNTAVVTGVWADLVFNTTSGSNCTIGIAGTNGTFTAMSAATPISTTQLQFGLIDPSIRFDLSAAQTLQINLPAGVTLIRGTLYAIFQ